MGLFSRLFGGADREPPSSQIPKQASGVSGAEALERRAKSIAFLKQKGVPVMDGLPVIEDSLSAKLRTPKEISERLIACTICALAGESGDKAFTDQVIADFAAEKLLSPKERDFVETKVGDQHQRAQFAWRYERSWVLLWALGYIERLDYPTAICDVPRLVRLVRDKSVDQLARTARPRRLDEILDEADLIYRLDWAVVDERVNRRVRVPKEVDGGVVLERHAALNWLVGYMGQEWDDISTDT